MSLGPAAADFRLIIVRGDLESLELDEYADAILKLEAAGRADPLFTIDLDGIARYHWSRQTITLTPGATSALAAALDRAGDRAALGPLDAMKAKLGWGTAVERALYLRGFVVLAEGMMRYGGIFLDAMSQRPIRFPVIRVSEAPNGRVVLSMLPIHLPFQAHDPITEGGALNAARAAETAGERLPGPLEEMIASSAAGEPAAAFRRTIRSPGIKAVVASAGKLDPSDGP